MTPIRLSSTITAMNEATALEAAKNLAMQKVGRNLYNYQKLEALLKQLAGLGSITSKLDQLKDAIEARNDKVSKMTLGAVVGEVGRLMFESEHPTDEQLEMYDIVFGYAIKLGDSQERKTFQAELKGVVDTRNSLVHGLLPHFTPESIESCRQLSKRLDEEREQFLCVWRRVVDLALEAQSLTLAYVEAAKRELQT